MNQSPALIEPPEPQDVKQSTARPVMNIGDVCILKKAVKRDFGTIPAGTPVEIVAQHEKKSLFAVKTLNCKGCDLVITFTGIKAADLEDYETHNPARLIS